MPLKNTAFADVHPRLLEHLADSVWGDGKKRQTSTLTVIVDGPVFKVCLNNRDEELNAWVSGETIDDCLLSLEMGLQDDTIEWRRPAYLKKK